MREKLNEVIQLTNEEWENFILLKKTLSIKARQLIYEPAKVFRSVYYLHRGAARSYLTENDEAKTFYFFFEGDWIFDLTSYVTGRQSLMVFESIEDCEIWRFSKEDLQRLYVQHPNMVRFDLFQTQREYIKLSDRLIQFYADDLESRYLKLLDQHPALFQRVPQHMIASYLGVKSQSLSRIKQSALSRRK